MIPLRLRVLFLAFAISTVFSVPAFQQTDAFTEAGQDRCVERYAGDDVSDELYADLIGCPMGSLAAGIALVGGSILISLPIAWFLWKIVDFGYILYRKSPISNPQQTNEGENQ